MVCFILIKAIIPDKGYNNLKTRKADRHFLITTIHAGHTWADCCGFASECAAGGGAGLVPVLFVWSLTLNPGIPPLIYYAWRAKVKIKGHSLGKAGLQPTNDFRTVFRQHPEERIQQHIYIKMNSSEPTNLSDTVDTHAHVLVPRSKTRTKTKQKKITIEL